VNLFDFAAGLVLVVSALIGFSRGAVLELVTLFAFTVAATLSVWLLPFTSPIAHAHVHPSWAANMVATVVTFLAAYIALRVLGASVSRGLRSQATLGSIDRTVGLGFGVARALVVLGVVYLVFSATPVGRPPALIAQARLFPLARASGQTLASLAPGGLKEMTGFGRLLRDRASGTPSDDAETEQGDAPAYTPPTPADTPQDAPVPHRTLQVIGGDAPLPRRHHRHAQPAEPVE
jgi:membrane protein required for colicin V production